MKKILFMGLMGLILLMGLVLAADFTPQGDINLRGVYQIKNATNISAEYYCNSTDCYTIASLLSGGITYSHLSNFTDDLGNRGYTSLFNFSNDPEYYNSTDFSIADYFTSAEVLGFGYYNSSDFSISNYFTKTEVLGFSYWNYTSYGGIGNWSDDKSDYFTSTEVLGFSYYNSTDFDINDYYLNSNPFNFWNSTSNEFNKTYADTLYRADSWDNFTGIPTATPNDGDTTHFSTADQIRDWVISLAYSAFGASVDDTEMTAEDFGEFTCTGNEDGCTLDSGSFDDEYIELGDSFAGEVTGVYGSLVVGNDVLDDQYYDSEADLTGLLDNNYEPISAHFDATTTNITCLNSPGCTNYFNATDECHYWSSGGKDCVG